jgi:hypothetical protein
MNWTCADRVDAGSCAIRSCLATAARHAITWPGALTRAAEGNPWIPGTT